MHETKEEKTWRYAEKKKYMDSHIFDKYLS